MLESDQVKLLHLMKEISIKKPAKNISDSNIISI
jgi:hypothetical protein